MTHIRIEDCDPGFTAPLPRRLASRLRAFLRRKATTPPRLDPDVLSDHMRRDLGLADGRAWPRHEPPAGWSARLTPRF